MNLLKVTQATLRLFKSIYVEEGNTISLEEDDIIDFASKGLLLSSKIKFNSREELEEVKKEAIDLYGVNLFELSNTFHKTWKTVEEIDPALHYLQELVHYISTYGLDSLGIPYDGSHAYLPKEKIPYPEDIVPFNFILLNSIDIEEIDERLSPLLESGVALSQQQVNDVVTLVDFIQSKDYEFEIEKVKNKEVKAILWSKLDDKPYINVDEFLRVLTYITTNSSLLVRSYRNHKITKFHLGWDKDKKDQVNYLLSYYVNKFGIENVASQFLRNKMVFLSFKNDENKSLINKIRRIADKYNKPMQVKHLLAEDIYNANIWQLIKYYNLCTSYLNPTADKLYQIRNGENYLAENKNYSITGEAKRIVTEHYQGLKNIIESELKKKLEHLKDMYFIVPDYIDYRVPSSLKRLCSGVPEGSVVILPEDSNVTIGVHWTNILNKKGKEERVDLDLHANSLERSIGWCYNYKDDYVAYSGDVTDAPIDKGGSSEALRFTPDCDNYVITLNNFTQSPKVPYKFIIDFDSPEIVTVCNRNESNGYIFSQNVRTLNSSIKLSQNTLGFISNHKFYFMNSSIFSGPVTYNDDLLKRLITYYNDSQNNQLTFKQLADIIGFKIVNRLEDIPRIEVEHEDAETTLEYVPYIDLSLESITEDTFPRIFSE